MYPKLCSVVFRLNMLQYELCKRRCQVSRPTNSGFITAGYHSVECCINHHHYRINAVPALSREAKFHSVESEISRIVAPSQRNVAALENLSWLIWGGNKSLANT